MARNVEIKARIASVESLIARVTEIADQGPIVIAQDDTFFVCPNGRLKLRAFSEIDGQLIFYKRSDQTGPKESFYVISPTLSPNTLREALTFAYGQSGRVKKQRILFMVGRTRVHLDQVEGLGHFLELEVVMTDTETTEEGMAVADALMERLGIQADQLVQHAYVDLLNEQKNVSKHSKNNLKKIEEIA